MSIQDPQQELFGELMENIRAMGYKVYDGLLPPEDAVYPFVYMADTQEIDSSTKTQVIGTINQAIHVWSDDPYKRGTLSSLMQDIKSVARTVEHTDNFSYILMGITQRVLTDRSTQQPLIHGILELEYKYS